VIDVADKTCPGCRGQGAAMAGASWLCVCRLKIALDLLAGGS
jgi:hypothetical protein